MGSKRRAPEGNDCPVAGSRWQVEGNEQPAVGGRWEVKSRKPDLGHCGRLISTCGVSSPHTNAAAPVVPGLSGSKKRRITSALSASHPVTPRKSYPRSAIRDAASARKGTASLTADGRCDPGGSRERGTCLYHDTTCNSTQCLLATPPLHMCDHASVLTLGVDFAHLASRSSLANPRASVPLS